MTPRRKTGNRAAGYVPVSQVGGREGDSFHSPELQRERIEAWATYRQFEIVDWYVDLDAPASKGSPPRPQFEKLMADAIAGRFDVVAVYRLTRFARSVKGAAEAYDVLEKHDVGLVSVTEDLDTTTANGRFTRNMLFSLAEFEADRIGEEWRNVHDRRRRNGFAHISGPVLGYHVEGGRIVRVDDATADTVRDAYRLRAQGLGLTGVSDELRRLGHKTATGQPRFATSTLSRILSNPLYAGLLDWKGERIPGEHDALVDPDEWRRVQAIGRRANRYARHTSPALLAGLAVCSGCGHNLTHSHEGRGRARSYRCRANVQRYAITCPAPVSIRADSFEAYVDAAMVDLLRANLQDMPHGGRVGAKRDRRIDRARVRAAQAQDQIKKLTDGWTRGIVPEDEYVEHRNRYTAERDEALDLIDVATATAARKIDTSVVELYPTLDVRGKRETLRLVLDRVVVNPSPVGATRTCRPDRRVDLVWSPDVG